MLKELMVPKALNDHYDDKLVSYVESFDLKVMPHFLFSGEPGTGKTQFAHLIANRWLGHSKGLNFHEFNSSDDRGIDFVKGTLKELSRASGFGFLRKIILLDEADGLTKDAQECLRRMIETGSALFILTANNVSKIIPALQSRLSCWDFKGPSVDWLRTKCAPLVSLSSLCTLPSLDPNVLEETLKISKPSFRDLFKNYDLISKGLNVPIENRTLLSMSLKDFIDASFTLDPSIVIRDLHKEILGLKHKKKDKMIIELAETDYKCSQMCSKVLQLQAGFLKIYAILKEDVK